ncbi:MAG: hypothetical protein ACYC9S_09350 [Leptospirales bacterium]
MSKRGDQSLRTILIHGARSVLRLSGGQTDPSAHNRMGRQQAAVRDRKRPHGRASFRAAVSIRLGYRFVQSRNTAFSHPNPYAKTLYCCRFLHMIREWFPLINSSMTGSSMAVRTSTAKRRWLRST